jgi:hypothetical protein
LHPGIDINGSGKGDTDIRLPVFAIGNGYITDATDYTHHGEMLSALIFTDGKVTGMMHLTKT